MINDVENNVLKCLDLFYKFLKIKTQMYDMDFENGEYVFKYKHTTVNYFNESKNQTLHKKINVKYENGLYRLNYYCEDFLMYTIFFDLTNKKSNWTHFDNGLSNTPIDFDFFK